MGDDADCSESEDPLGRRQSDMEAYIGVIGSAHSVIGTAQGVIGTARRESPAVREGNRAEDEGAGKSRGV